MKSLDLGCGPNPKNPFNAEEVFGIDILTFNNPNIKIADLAIDPIPFEDNEFDYVTGFDFLEHIPRILYFGRERKQPFIDIMSETWRVLKPGGEALFATPAFPSEETFQDPQHVNFISRKTVQYFCQSNPQIFKEDDSSGYLPLGNAYGFVGAFEAIQVGWREDVPYHLVWHLKAVK